MRCSLGAVNDSVALTLTQNRQHLWHVVLLSLDYFYSHRSGVSPTLNEVIAARIVAGNGLSCCTQNCVRVVCLEFIFNGISPVSRPFTLVASAFPVKLIPGLYRVNSSKVDPNLRLAVSRMRSVRS